MPDDDIADDDDTIEIDEELVARTVRTLLEVKAELEVLEAQRKKLQTELVTTLLGSDRESIDVTVDGDRKVTATVIQPDKTVIHEAQLKRKVGAKKFAKIVTTKVDRSKLEAAVQIGEIDINDVAECTTIEPGTAYIKTTPKRG